MNKVLVVGDRIVDVFIEHTSTRKSPEANCPVLVPANTQTFRGGAENVYLNIQSMGGEARLFWHGEATTKTRIIVDGQQLCRIDEPRKPFPPVTPFKDAELTKAMQWADVVVLSDYGLGTLDDPQYFIRKARAMCRPVLVDPHKSKQDWHIYDGATAIKANWSEYESSNKDSDVDYFIITKGAEGCYVKGRNSSAIHVPAHPVQQVDVTGAGDSHLAALSLVWHRLEPAKACVYANRAGAVAVTRRMTTTVMKEEVFND